VSAQYRGLNLVILGPPGSGKGTQAKVLCERYSIPHISTGDILREEVRFGTDLGLQARAAMERGELVPDRLVAGIILRRLDQDDCARGFILDGFPRTVEQAGMLDDLLAELGRSLELALLVTVDDRELIRRLAGRRSCPDCGCVYHVDNKPALDGRNCDICSVELIQREDDAEAVVRDRLSLYRVKTSPVAEYYQRRGMLAKVAGDRAVAEVTESLLEAIGGPVAV